LKKQDEAIFLYLRDTRIEGKEQDFLCFLSWGEVSVGAFHWYNNYDSSYGKVSLYIKTKQEWNELNQCFILIVYWNICLSFKLLSFIFHNWKFY
jgi:hypothetical protein